MHRQESPGELRVHFRAVPDSKRPDHGTSGVVLSTLISIGELLDHCFDDSVDTLDAAQAAGSFSIPPEMDSQEVVNLVSAALSKKGWRLEPVSVSVDSGERILRTGWNDWLEQAAK